MLSKRTLLEMIRLVEKMTINEIDRLYTVFEFQQVFTKMGAPAPTKSQKATQIYSLLTGIKYSNGPFTDNIELDLLQYIIDEFFRGHQYMEEPGFCEYNRNEPPIKFHNAFYYYNKAFCNTLKLDGYVIEGKTVKKLLPEQIVESQVETQIETNLKRFGFLISEGHLNQAISNYTQGNWAGANSQFRTFIESLLIEITAKLIPANPVRTASQAINVLSQTVNPPFLSVELNEVPRDRDSDSFVQGLWVRLHPNGSHPGLSDEDDCTFRYHISIVFANYLLNRLVTRQ